MKKVAASKAKTKSRISLLPTGITGFDEILGGGLPAGSLYLIQGLAGSGKTTLACQMGFVHAKQEKKVLVLTLIAESHAKLLNHLSNFPFFDESLIGKQVIFFSGYTNLAKGGLRELLTFISVTLAEQNPEILIVDGFRSVRDSSPSDLALSEFMHSLNSLVSSMGCTTFLLSPVEGNIPDSENTLVDGLIELSQHEQGMRLVREVKIYKIRGGKHLLGKHVFEIKEDGIVIYPRFEAVATHANTAPAASSERISFGIPTWDVLTGGGVMKGSTTNILGSPGVGKTLMGLHFIQQGLRDKERCLIVGFYESPPRLIEKAKNVGIDFTKSIEDGNLEIIWHLPLEILIDNLATRLLENIEQRGVTRLFIDGVEGLRDIVMHPERAQTFLVALVNELRARGVTTFFTEQLPYFNEAITKVDSSASALYENMILLRYVEIGGVNHRQISVMKLRENRYDAANHIMTISDSGIAIDRPASTVIRANARSESMQNTDSK
jgi:circadian clock protein KaiC